MQGKVGDERIIGFSLDTKESAWTETFCNQRLNLALKDNYMYNILTMMYL
jgi:hypothetical protein